MSKINFLLTKDHIALARRMFIEWRDNPCLGAPIVDIKCPYGNGDILGDIAEIIGLDLFVDADDEKHMSKDQEDRCLKLHREMEVALQIILATGNFRPGLYEADEYDSLSWRLIKTGE